MHANERVRGKWIIAVSCKRAERRNLTRVTYADGVCKKSSVPRPAVVSPFFQRRMILHRPTLIHTRARRLIKLPPVVRRRCYLYLLRAPGRGTHHYFLQLRLLW